MTRETPTWRLFVCSAAVLAVAIVGAQPALAQDQPQPGEFQLGVGLKGGANGMGATEVPEDCPCFGPEGDGDPELYGLFGAGYAFGLSVDGRYDRTFGLETGFYYADDSTSGTNEIRDANDNLLGTVTESQSTTAYHIPVLLKASPPFDNVRPIFGLGLEFVLQQSSDLEYTGQNVSEADIRQRNQHNSVEPSNYTLLQFTAGVEIDAGPIRIPIEMRAGYNIGWNDTIDERTTIENINQSDERIIYNGEYLGHFGLHAGVLYRWDLEM